MVIYEAFVHRHSHIATLVASGPGVFFVYRMRGYDTTLASHVYWTSDHADTAATDYPGQGPVTDIIVQHVGKR